MRLLGLIAAGVSVLLCGCVGPSAPSSTGCPTTFVMNVTPTAGSATHGAQAPGNQVTFTASDEIPGSPFPSKCVLSNVISEVMWTSSDTVNVQLTSDPDTSTVVATCVGATTVPVTITASQFVGGLNGAGTATLTCK